MEAVKTKSKHKQKKLETKNPETSCHEPLPEVSANVNITEELLEASADTPIDNNKELNLENSKEIESFVAEEEEVEGSNNREESKSCNHPEDNIEPAVISAPEEPQTDHEIKASELKTQVFALDVKEKCLYPELTKEEPTKVQQLRPYTENQLAALYKNTELEVLETFTSQFIEAELKGLSIKRHPLYELLNNYLQAREKISGNTLELNQTLKEYNEQRGNIWTIENSSISGRGQCGDGCVLTTSQVYSKAIFHRSVFETVNRLLKNVRSFVHQNHVLYSYLAENLRLQIELHIQSTISTCLSLSNIQPYSLVSIRFEEDPEHLRNALSEMRLSISVLFSFQRRLIRDSDFLKETRDWLSRLVAVLLRSASYQDHLFLLSHILRCPGGVSNWAAAYVQTPLPENGPDSPFGSFEINHVVATLAMVLSGIEKREEFLESLGQSKEAAGDAPWIMVDSDGEEDEESSGSYLRENDLVAVLNQLRIDDMFRVLLLVDKRDFKDVFDPSKISEYHILKLLSFSTVLLKIFHRGLNTYRQERYMQFAKRLSRFTRHIVQYITDVWEQFKASQLCSDRAMLLRLQTEYDAFFLRATHSLYTSQKMGAWQFLAVVPYHQVSVRALWKIFYFLHESEQLAPGILKFDEVGEEYSSKIWEPNARAVFEEKLSELSDAEVYYLLNAFANMALARGNEDMEFIKAATLDLFHVGFINESTQESCSKSTRILLSHITSKHPHLLSDILNLVKDNLDKMYHYSLYVYEDLPLSIWKPTESDIKQISFMLLNHPATSNESYLARMILSRMNWGFIKDKELFLPKELHRQVGLLVAVAAEKEQAFNEWAWLMATRLKLHLNDLGVSDFSSVPEVEQFDVIYRGVREQQPLACFLSVLMTTYGHMIPLLCKEGLSQLVVLQNHGKHDSVLFALSNIVPLFVHSQELLINLEVYQNVLNGLINADNTYINMVVAQNTVVKQFGYMIEAQIANYNWYGLDSPKLLVRLWTNSLVSITNWSKNYDVLYLLDVIVRSAFFYRDAFEAIGTILRELMQGSPQESSSGFFKWVSSSSPTRNFPTASLSSYTWLAYVLINLEFEEKECSGLWFEILRQLQLQKGKVNVDAAIKKAASIRKVSSFSSGSLCLYRWAQQVMDTPVDHPLVPLLWQKFFTLYLTRVPFDRASDRGCVGEKFFEGLINFTFLKRLKRRLQEDVDYHQKNLTAQSEDEDCDRNLVTKLENYLRLFTAYSLWLEEPRLHDLNLHLASLPPQYLSQLLSLIIVGDSTPWLEYVDNIKIKTEQEKHIEAWYNVIHRGKRKLNLPTLNPGKNTESTDPIERILRRLVSYDAPIEPPKIISNTLPVPRIDLRTKDSMLSSLEKQFMILQQFSRSHSEQISRHLALDVTYQELLPQLYQSDLKKIVKKVPCKGKNNTVLCSSPAKITLQIQESRVNERVDQQMGTNRNDFDLLVTKSLQAPAKNLCLASVAVQQCIQEIQKQVKTPATSELGVELFYKIFSLLDEETFLYPPTKFLIETSLQQLGRSHISNSEYEMPKLLEKILSETQHTELLVPYFTTKPVGTATLLRMYETLCQKITEKKDVHVYLLSKFDIKSWLSTKSPKIHQRSELLRTTISALCALPSDHNRLQEIFRQHLLAIFEYQFPEHYGEVLVCLLNASNTSSQTGAIPVAVWSDVLNSISKPIEIKRETLRQFAQNQRRLQHQELLETCGLLARHFGHERLQYGLYGLYPRCRGYVEVYGLLMGMIGHGLVVSSMNVHEGVLGDKLCELIWPNLRDMFTPWLVPYSAGNLKENMAAWIQQLTDDRALVLPWITVDGPFAQKILQMFLECILFLMYTLPGSSIIYTYVWQWYATCFAHPMVKDHVLNPVHSVLAALPWHNFWPTVTDLEFMHRVIEQYLPTCHNFLGHVFMAVPWPVWMGNIGKVPPQVAAKIYQSLLYLLVKLSIEPQVRTCHSEKIKALLVQAENFDWTSVDAGIYQQLVDWYVMSCDSSVIFKSDPMDLDFRLFCFLKVVSGYDKKSERQSQDFFEKRRIFVRSFVKLYSVFQSRHKSLVASKETEMKNLMVSELNHLEVVTTSDSELKILLGEFLCILNYKSVNEVMEETLLSWIKNKCGNSVFIEQLLLTAGIAIEDQKFVAIVLETTIDVYFKNRDPQSEDPSWTELTNLIQTDLQKTPQLEKTAIDLGCVFTLTVLLLKLSKKPKNQLDTINAALNWLDDLKPTETMESKLPVLWMVILKLSIQSCRKDESGTSVALRRFAEILSHCSEDKGSGGSIWRRGILGAIGIGKQPQISLNFRFLARALAGYVLAQLPGRSVRKEANAECTVGQPGGNTECVKLLLGLEFGQTQGKIKDCAEYALKTVQNTENSLHNSTTFLMELSKQFYSKPYIRDFDI